LADYSVDVAESIFVQAPTVSSSATVTYFVDN